MSLEAIAALLGHRSMKMTLTYARITDTTIAEEHFRVTAAVEANYGGDELPRHRRSGDDPTRRRSPTAPRQRLLQPPRRPRLCLRTTCERCGFSSRRRVRARPHPPT
jgi:hypothetical protein